MDTEVADKIENSMHSLEEITVYEVVTEYRPMSVAGQIISNYPQIFIKLCDGEIISTESGERIIDLTQFIADNGLEKPPRIDHDSIPIVNSVQDRCTLIVIMLLPRRSTSNNQVSCQSPTHN